MASKTYSEEDLELILEKGRKAAICKIEFITPLAGGVPASDKGLQAFVQHHLGIDPESDDFEKTVARIKYEELGEEDTTPEGGEVKEESVYGVNMIRSNDKGPFVLEHQIKALIKQAASRLGLFVKKRGSKGDVAEMGTVLAHGVSLIDVDRPFEIYLTDPTNGFEALTHFDVLNGSVSTPAGKKSIQTHTQVAEEGTVLEFEFRWPDKKLKADDIVEIFAAMRAIGLGSCLSLGYGKFKVLSLEVIS